MFLRVLKYDFLVFLTLIKYQKYSSCENYKFFGNSIIYIYLPLVDPFPISCSFSRDHRAASSREWHAARVGKIIHVYLRLPLQLPPVILGLRASSDRLHLILSNPPKLVSILHCLAQFVAQLSFPLGRDTICDELGNHLPYTFF